MSKPINAGLSISSSILKEFDEKVINKKELNFNLSRSFVVNELILLAIDASEKMSFDQLRSKSELSKELRESIKQYLHSN